MNSVSVKKLRVPFSKVWKDPVSNLFSEILIFLLRVVSLKKIVFVFSWIPCKRNSAVNR